MIIEVFVLALASTVRPTSLAAVSALLAGDSRRRLMFAYVTGGLAFTLLFGLLVIGVFHGVHIHAGSDRTKAVADTVGGALALLFGFAVLAGVLLRRDRVSRDAGRSWMARFNQRITVRVAAVFGPLTHIPGIFYLIALNVIVAHDPRLPGGLIALGVYNGIWFAIPIAALVLCIADPDLAHKVVLAVQEWAKAHSRTIVLATSFIVGIALVIRGALSI
jgi:cytochrome bd-type quinol oxidase subunit 2